MKSSKNLSQLVQEFFFEYLINQKKASQHTITAYRDTFSLLFRYAKNRFKKQPEALELKNLDASFIGEFLNHLEKDRGSSARSRNQRLAAIRSFFHYISLYVSEYIALIQQVLAIPNKRYEKKIVKYLERSEIEALLSAPNVTTWIGRRDHALLMLMIQTGVRVSELTGLCCQDVMLGSGGHLHCMGKGRKERTTPLTKDMIVILRSWLKENNSSSSDPLFPSSRGGPLSADSVQYLIAKYVVISQNKCPSLKQKRISPHVLRHTTAMQMLQAGIDRSMIALWLGHESVETTQIYLDANLSMKEKILEKLVPLNGRKGRFKADGKLLTFLKSL